MKWLFSIWLFTGLYAPAQDSITQKKNWEWNGYVKDLQTLNFDKNFKNLIAENLVHNRINMKWKPSAKFTVAAEFRNRLFWSDEIRNIPAFTKQLRNENEVVNMSAVWMSKSNSVSQSNVERLWMEYRKAKWNFRFGRQRINWGITTSWNPNDIFNTYNFLDVDFEERPGIDAGKFQYQLNDFSNIEIAYYPGNNKFRQAGAVKYFINKGGYDIQLISGIYQNRFTAGTGWAGSINDAGFKGEIQYFAPQGDSSGHLNLSVESDYVFKKGWYVNLGLLYNSEGISKKINDWNSLSFKFSPLHLMPTRWNFIASTAKEFTPLFTGNLTVLFSPGTNLILILPSFGYSLFTNIEINWIWQSFVSEIQNQFQAVRHHTFIRLKWNF